MLEINNLKGVSDYLPLSPQNAIGQPPICDVERVVGRNQVCRFIEFELIKLSTLVSVGNNLNDNQVQFIAASLVEMFPNESLADFKICFHRGAIGQYGEIYRMDGIVLRKWMESYLNEKYELVEAELKKGKDEIYKKHDTRGSDIADKYINEMLENFKPTRKEKEITDKEIQEEGMIRPKAVKHPSTPESLVVEREYHNAWIRANFDPYTGKKLDTWMPELEWIELNKL